MRFDKVAARAAVVIAMALMGWFSPTTAAVPEEPGCDEYFCVELMECDIAEQVRICNAFCPQWDYTNCENQECPLQGYEELPYMICEDWS